MMAVIAAFCIADSASAQNVVINAVELDPSDLTAQTSKYARRDRLGQPCALVKVAVVADDVNFHGDVVGEPVHVGAEYWVYMINGSKQLRISCPLFKTETIFFPSYSIPELEGEHTYVVDLSLPQSTPQWGTLYLNVIPSESKVFVNNKEIEVVNGIATKPLRPGHYTFRVESEGYKTTEGKFIIEKDKTMQRNIKLYSVANLKVHAFRGPNGKYGFKDPNNKVVVKPAYDKVFGAANVFWATKKGKYGMIDQQGTELSGCDFDEVLTSRVDGIFIVSQGGKYGVMNSNGWLTVPCILDKISTTSSELMVGVMDGQYGLIDANGELVIPCENEEITDFHDGMAGIKHKGKCGFVNTEGLLVIPFKYEGISHFSGGMARVNLDGTHIYINKNGEVIEM